jgi:hypothetical protein
MERDVGVFVKTCLNCLAVRGGGTIPRPLLSALHANRPN